MKYIKLLENFDSYDPYSLMVMFPNERLKLFIEEIKKPISEQNLNLVRDLINLGTINTQDADDKTPLHWAAWHGKGETARMLIDAGADVNLKDEYGETPLDIAVSHDEIEITQMLIDAGADVDWRDEDGDWTPLHRAASAGNVEIVRMLIDAGAKLNVKDTDGDTPLHVAALYGNEKIAQMLIDAGADQTILNNDGLHWYEARWHPDDEYYEDEDEE